MNRFLLYTCLFAVSLSALGETDYTPILNEISARIGNGNNSLSTMIGHDMDLMTWLSQSLLSGTLEPMLDDTSRSADALEYAFGSGSGPGYAWLRGFLIGNINEPMQNTKPYFSTLSATTGRPLFPASFTGQNLTTFLSYMLGQNIDYRPGLKSRLRWDDLFTTNSVFKDGDSTSQLGFSFWNVWQAEAYRRQIDALSNLVYSASSAAASNDWIAAEQDFTTNVVASSPEDAEWEVDQPESVDWFGQNVVPSVDWELEGSAIDPIVYNDSSRGLTLRLSFEGWGPVCRSVLQFVIAVSTGCALVGIVRSEIDYWTTLGGSAS